MKPALALEEQEISRIVYENYKYGTQFGAKIARALTEVGFRKVESPHEH